MPFLSILYCTVTKRHVIYNYPITGDGSEGGPGGASVGDPGHRLRGHDPRDLLQQNLPRPRHRGAHEALRCNHVAKSTYSAANLRVYCNI